MNIVKELEEVLKQPNFMGATDKTGVNLAVNAILDRIDELGFDLVERKSETGTNRNCKNCTYACYRSGINLIPIADDELEEMGYIICEDFTTE